MINRAAFSALFSAFIVTMAIVSLSGCKRAKQDVDGIGPYRLGHTTVADSSGACAPYETYTMCSNNGGVAIAGKPAIVDLYFPDSNDSSTLTEIVLTIKRCNTDAVDAAFRKELGEPVAQVGGRIGWQNSKATIIAQLPAEKDICEINFLHPSEKARIEKLMPR